MAELCFYDEPLAAEEDYWIEYEADAEPSDVAVFAMVLKTGWIT